MHDVIKQAEKDFFVKVSGFTKVRESFFLNTNKGNMILKKQYSTKDTVMTYAEVSAFLHNAGFNNIESYLNANGLPYIEYEGSLYTLASCGDGAKCVFTNTDQANDIAAALAKMHILQRGADYNGIPWAANAHPIFYSKRIAEMRHIKKWLNRQSSYTDADIIFINNYNNFSARAEAAASIIVKYLAAHSKKMCVGKIKEDNILLSRNSGVTFINMENFTLSIACTDLCELIRRFIKRGGDNLHVQHIINAYSAVNPLTINDMSFIFAYLSFPYKFFSLSNKYYNSKRIYKKTAHCIKLRNCAVHQNKIYAFLEESDYIK